MLAIEQMVEVVRAGLVRATTERCRRKTMQVSPVRIHAGVGHRRTFI
jgi:hypothetical protein